MPDTLYIRRTMFATIDYIHEVKREHASLIRHCRDFHIDTDEPEEYLYIASKHGFHLAWRMISGCQRLPSQTIRRLLTLDPCLPVRDKCAIFEAVSRSPITMACVKEFLRETEVTIDDIMWCITSGAMPYRVLCDNIQLSTMMTFDAYELLTNLGIDVHPSLNHRYGDGTKDFHGALGTLPNIVMNGDDIVFPAMINCLIFLCYVELSNTAFDILMKIAPRYSVNIQLLTGIYMRYHREFDIDTVKKFSLKPDTYAYRFDVRCLDILRDQRALIIPIAQNYHHGSIMPWSWWDANPSIARTKFGQIRMIMWYEPRSYERIRAMWESEENGMRVGNFVRTLVEYDSYIRTLTRRLTVDIAEIWLSKTYIPGGVRMHANVE